MAPFPTRPLASPVEPPPYLAARPADRARNLMRGRLILANARDSLGRAGMPALHRVVDGASDALGAIGARLVNGSIGLADWFLASLDQVVVRDRKSVDILEPIIDRQAGFLVRFRQQVAYGAATLGPAIVARARQYGHAVWAGAMNARRELMKEKYSLERRVLGGEHACPDCPAYAAEGWVEVGTLPSIGESACGSMCKCVFEFK
jgi:hypothetical protein